jgi:hypothetical protein
MLILGLLEIEFALLAYYKVVKFSSKNFEHGDRLAIISVYELPPKLFLRSVVSLDSLYGI